MGCAHAYAYVHAHAYAYAANVFAIGYYRVRRYICEQEHTRMHMPRRTHTDMHMHMRTHTDMHMHMHTLTPVVRMRRCTHTYSRQQSTNARSGNLRDAHIHVKIDTPTRT